MLVVEAVVGLPAAVSDCPGPAVVVRRGEVQVVQEAQQLLPAKVTPVVVPQVVE